jgi:hypothetical protein
VQRERLGNAATKSEYERNLKQQSYGIDGLETRPGDIVPPEKFKMALPLQVDYQELTTAAKDFKKKLIDPSASLEDQRTAYYRMFDKIKKSNNYGANFSSFEQALAAAGITPIKDITSPQMISDRMLAEIRGLDPIAKLDEFIAVTTREHQAKLKPLGYYPPGTFQQQGVQSDLSAYDTLTKNQIIAESAANPNAVSPKGAFGLMQLTEPAIIDVARRIGIEPEKAIELARTNKEFNVFIGQTYKNMMREQFPNEDEANAAYNAGPGAVKKYGGIPPYKETQDYVAKLRRMRELEARRPR